MKGQRMQTLLPTTLLLLSLLCGEMVVVVEAYPEGPPVDSCTHMFPTGHHADAMTSINPPYNLTATVANNQLTEGAVVTLTLAVTGNQDYPYYEGVFVQARKADCSSDAPIGTFTVPDNDNFLKTMRCNETDKSAVSHKVKEHITTKTFSWTAPAASTGRIYFRATVVKSEKVFWTNVFSGYLTYAGDSSQAPTQYCTVRTSSAPALTSSIMAALVLSALGIWSSL